MSDVSIDLYKNEFPLSNQVISKCTKIFAN